MKKPLPAQDPDVRVLDLMRGEVLAGRPLVVFAGISGLRLEPLLREAAFVAGREADLMTVQAYPFGTLSRAHPNPARLSVSDIERRRSVGGMTGRSKPSSLGKWNRERSILDERPTNPYPVARLYDVVSKSRMLYVQGNGMTAANIAAHAVRSLWSEARLCRREPPLVLVTGLDANMPVVALDLRCKWATQTLQDGDWEVAALGSAAAWDRARSEAVGEARWREVGENAGLGLDPVEADGLAVLRDGGRTVAVAAGGRGLAGVEILPGGWCNAFSALADGPVDADAVARRVRMGGPGCLDGSRNRDACVGHPDHLPRNVVPAAARRALLGFARDEADLDLQAACLSTSEPDKLHVRVSVPGSRGEWRRQFAKAMPGLSGLLMDRHVALAVDRGEESLPVVAGILWTTPAIVRRCVGRRGIPEPASAASDRDELRHSMRWLELFGHDAVPRDEAGWQAFGRCSDLAFGIFSGSSAPEGGVLALAARLLSAMPGGWERRSEALAGYERSEANDLGDVVRGYQDLLCAIDPRIPHGMEKLGSYDRVGLPLMADHGSLPRLLDASRRWHDDPLLAHSDGGADPNAAWEVPFGRFDLGDGWSATCLASGADLVDEGGHGPDRNGLPGLRHCVAGYASACLYGRSLIVSLRRDAGDGDRRMATAELVRWQPMGRARAEWFVFGKNRLRLRQLRGQNNKVPENGSREALDRLRDALAAERVPLDDGALREREFAGLSLAAAEASERLELWRPYLPKGLAGKPGVVQAQAGVAAWERWRAA